MDSSCRGPIEPRCQSGRALPASRRSAGRFTSSTESPKPAGRRLADLVFRSLATDQTRSRKYGDGHCRGPAGVLPVATTRRPCGSGRGGAAEGGEGVQPGAGRRSSSTCSTLNRASLSAPVPVERQPDHPEILGVGSPLDQSGGLGPIDQLDRAVVASISGSPATSVMVGPAGPARSVSSRRSAGCR